MFFRRLLLEMEVRNQHLSDISINLRIIAEGLARISKTEYQQLKEDVSDNTEIFVEDKSLEQIAIEEREDLREKMIEKNVIRRATDPFWQEDNMSAEELEML